MESKEQKQKAKEFVEIWIQKIAETPINKSNERRFCQLFWTTLLTDVFGIEKVAEFIDYERPVPKEFASGKNFIDGYIPSTKVLIEQKGSNIPLSKGELQSDGQYLTPYQQAKRYGSNQNYSDRPRWIIVSNFVSFEIHDMDKMDSQPYIIKLEDLPNELHNLSMIYDTGKQEIKEEMALSVEAGKIVDELYEILCKKYNNSPAHQRSLNMLCVRLIFLLYADDSELFGAKGMFHKFVEGYNAENLSDGIKQLFQVLNVKEEDRPNKFFDLPEKFAQFPYVNGNLFSEEDNLIPQFSEEIKTILLEKGNFNWKDISPTIFGAVFESTLNPETRHDGGMHYTSIENIHKVIDPLFLDDLKAEFESIKTSSKSINKKKEEFEVLQNKLASIKIFDPACGSGNFLTESYLSLRRLENKILDELGNSGLFTDSFIKVSIQQFYGIEINDFAVSVAKTALWIAEAQTYLETTNAVSQKSKFFPLETYNNITEGNALRLDWKTLVPEDLTYIVGNPPFLGYSNQSELQKSDILSLYIDEKGKPYKTAGKIDYVSGWYWKASEFIKNTDVKCCFVSTNSITQGEQVASVWKPLFERFDIKINFAYRTFIWNSESTEKAHVYCVIIGFSYLRTSKENNIKRIYTSEHTSVESENINPYLINFKNIWIEARKKPLCKISEMIYGNKPTDGGFLFLSENERDEIIKKSPISKKYIKQVLGAEEFINNKKRFCLWFVEANPSELIKCSDIMNRIKSVENFRLSSTKTATQKSAGTPTLFQEVRQPTEGNYILIPCHSGENRKYIPVGFFDFDIITTNANQIIPNASIYEFGILTSNVHNAWMRVVAGRLGMSYRYSKDIVYNNFPFPEPTSEQKAKIEQTAQAILDARAKYPDSSLGEMYSNLLLYPELNTAHKNNDFAVIEAYGFERNITESECVGKLFEMYEKLTK